MATGLAPAAYGEAIPLDLEILFRDSPTGIEPNPTTQLYLAILSNDTHTVKDHLTHGANPNASGSNGVALLDIALDLGNLGIIDELRSRGARGMPCATALHRAAIFNDCKLASKALASGCPINCCRECSITPLHDAAYRGNVEVTQFLLEHGADPNAVNYFGRTPLHDSLYQSEWITAAQLIQHNADLNSTDTSGIAPWQLIAKKCADSSAEELWDENKAAISILLNALANHKTNPANNISALHTAAYYLNEQAVKALLEHGAASNCKNFLGKTPLHDAVDPEALHNPTLLPPRYPLNLQARIVSMLLKAGADLNISDNNGDTPLHIACRRGRKEVARILLDHNARLDIPNRFCQTALDYDTDNTIRHYPKLQILTLAMANHCRLGAPSTIQIASHDPYQRVLTDEVMQLIYSYLKKAY